MIKLNLGTYVRTWYFCLGFNSHILVLIITRYLFLVYRCSLIKLRIWYQILIIRANSFPLCDTYYSDGQKEGSRLQQCSHSGISLVNSCPIQG